MAAWNIQWTLSQDRVGLGDTHLWRKVWEVKPEKSRFQGQPSLQIPEIQTSLDYPESLTQSTEQLFTRHYLT